MSKGFHSLLSSGRNGTEAGSATQGLDLFDDERESFTQTFAYDHFQWPAFKIFGDVRPSVIDVRTPSERAAEERGLEGGDSSAPYTTTNSSIPIYTVGEVVPLSEEALLTPQTSLSGPLVAIDDFRADARFAGIDGSGYTIAVLDTGIDLDDPFFGPDLDGNGIADRIVYQYDFADNDANAGDVDGHGSNVASIAASSDGTYTGMAPGANIAALKVFSNSGRGYFDDIERALQWVIDNAEAYNIVSVNMSLSDSGNFNTPVGLYGIADELAALAAMDVIVVSASGNAFYELNSVQGVAYPSADPNSLSVGAVYDANIGSVTYTDGARAYSTDAGRITPFSQRDDALSDIFAPGAAITGAGAGNDLVIMHGTSQAAPHIAGIVALAQQLAVEVLGRKLTFAEFDNLLTSSADIIIDGDDESDNVANTGLTFPMVNVAKLGEAILDMALPKFAIAALDAVKPEGDAGTTAYTFTVTRSGNTSSAGTIDWAVSGSDVNGADFQGGSLPTGTLSFLAGQTSKILTVNVAGDTTLEADENFTVTLTNPSGNGQITTASAEGTIENDETTIEIAALNAVRAEGNGLATFFTFEVWRGGDTSQAGTVDYAVTSAQADATDFLNGILPSGTVTFGAGGFYKTFSIAVHGDSDFEADEDFTVTLSNASDGAEIITASAVGTIQNDDPMLTTFYEVSALDAVKAEGDSGEVLFSFLISRSGDISGPSSISYSMSGYTPDNADSFDFVDGIIYEEVVNFAAGQSTTTVNIRVTGDSDYEPDESFVVAIFNPSSGGGVVPGSSTAIGTILNDDPAPDVFYEIAAVDASKAEGDSGTTQLLFTVSRAGNISGAGTVDYAFVYGGANADDFVGGTLPSGTVSFAAGESVKNLIIEVAGDTTVESNESFTLLLSNPSPGSLINTATAVGTIQNDDFPPQPAYAITALDATKAEGDTGTTSFTFTITRSSNTSVFSSITYRVTGDSADDADFPGFVLAQGTANFAIGETSKIITINVEGDYSVEGDETFTVSLLNPGPGAIITTGSAQGTILNDDLTPAATLYSITAVDAVKLEGDSGMTDFTFLISRSGDVSSGGVVNYRVRGDEVETQDFGGSFYPGSGFNFLAGETSRLITIQVAGDSAVEGDEDFIVLLETPSPNSGVAVGVAQGTILDDDDPSASFLAIAPADAVQSEGNLLSPGLTFTVTRSGNTFSAVSVDYQVAGGSADAADFAANVLPSGTVSFLAGETSKTITIPIKDDFEVEGDEDFTVTLSNASAGATVTTASAQGTILNDDALPIHSYLSISAADAVKSEGDDGTTLFTFTVSRPGTIIESATVDYTVVGSGANPAEADDFAGGVLPSGSVIIQGEGVNSATITIAVAGDEDFESDETFTVVLSNPSAGAEIVTGSAEGTIQNDDMAGVIVLIDAAFDSGSDGFTFTPGLFGGNGSASLVSGSWDSGEIAIELGSATTTIWNITGGWEQSFTLLEDMEVTVSFDYRVFQSTGNEASENTQVVYSFDGGPAVMIDEVIGDGNQGPDDIIGPVTFEVDLGMLAAGTHSLALGAVLTKSNHPTEYSITSFDNVSVEGVVPVPTETFLSIAALNAARDEGDAGTTDFTFTVTRSGVTSGATTVDYTVSGAGADDFAGGVYPSGTISFAASETSKTVTVQVAGDTDYESDEGFTVTLSNASAGSIITTASASGTITNDDILVPGEAIVLVDAAFDSGSDGFTFTPGLFGGNGSASLVSGSWDSGEIAIELGSATTTIWNITGGWEQSFTLLEDMEVTVSFDYRVFQSTGNEASENTQVVYSFDGGPAVMIDEVIGDGNQGPDDIIGPVTFEVDLGMLAAGTHSLALGAVLTKSNHPTEYSITSFDNVSVEGVVPVPTETFLSIAALNAARDEGDAGTTDFTFTVTRSGVTSGATTVDYTVSGAGADDFAGGVYPSGTISFAASETSKTVTVQVAGDTDYESDEGFTVTLSNASAGSIITTASASGTITNDDILVPGEAIVLVDAAFDSGSDGFTFTPGLFGGNGSASLVSGSWDSGEIAIELGSATTTIWNITGGWEQSFTLLEDMEVTVSFDYRVFQSTGNEASENTQVVYSFDGGPAVMIDEVIGDGNQGPDDIIGPVTFEVDLGMLAAGTHSLALGAVLTKSNHPTEYSITSFDNVSVEGVVPVPTETFLSIAALNAARDEGDAGTTDFTFTVTRSGVTSGATTVDYTVSGAGADDFAGGVYPSGTISFAASETSKTVTVQVAGDTDYESDEGFTVTLSNASAGSIITTASASGTITNDDILVPGEAIVLVDAAFDSGSDGFTFTPGLFGGNGSASLVSGSWDSGEIAIELGSATTTIWNITGGWEQSFTLLEDMEVTVSFDYRVFQSTGNEASENTQVVYSFDGGPAVMIDEVIGDGNQGPDDIIGPVTFEVDLGMLAAGTHSLALGAVLTKSNHPTEYSITSFDNVSVEGVVPAPVNLLPEIAVLNETEMDDGPTALPSDLSIGTVLDLGDILSGNESEVAGLVAGDSGALIGDLLAALTTPGLSESELQAISGI